MGVTKEHMCQDSCKAELNWSLLVADMGLFKTYVGLLMCRAAKWLCRVEFKLPASYNEPRKVKTNESYTIN